MYRWLNSRWGPMFSMQQTPLLTCFPASNPCLHDCVTTLLRVSCSRKNISRSQPGILCCPHPVSDFWDEAQGRRSRHAALPLSRCHGGIPTAWVRSSSKVIASLSSERSSCFSRPTACTMPGDMWWEISRLEPCDLATSPRPGEILEIDVFLFLSCEVAF